METHKKRVNIRPKKWAVRPLRSANQMLYDKDFYKWTKAQAKLMKTGQLSALDIENLIEEIESLGKSDKRALRSHLANLLMHLLKKEYQSHKTSNSWLKSIRNARLEIHFILKDSPSLKNTLPTLIKEAYEVAKLNASEETKLPESTFPKVCPWEIREILG